jgi:hypothetical protein
MALPPERIVHWEPIEKMQTLGLTGGFTIVYNFKGEWVAPDYTSIPSQEILPGGIVLYWIRRKKEIIV